MKPKMNTGHLLQLLKGNRKISGTKVTVKSKVSVTSLKKKKTRTYTFTSRTLDWYPIKKFRKYTINPSVIMSLFSSQLGPHVFVLVTKRIDKRDNRVTIKSLVT